MLIILWSAGTPQSFPGDELHIYIRRLRFYFIPKYITLHFTLVNFISLLLPQSSGSCTSVVISLYFHIDIASKFCLQQILSGIFCAQAVNKNTGLKTVSWGTLLINFLPAWSLPLQQYVSISPSPSSTPGLQFILFPPSPSKLISQMVFNQMLSSSQHGWALLHSLHL